LGASFDFGTVLKKGVEEEMLLIFENQNVSKFFVELSKVLPLFDCLHDAGQEVGALRIGLFEGQVPPWADCPLDCLLYLL
jgi:hypothetical protein